MQQFLYVLSHIPHWTMMAVSIFAVIGAILAATTREDAFRAGDRQAKWVWVGLLAGSALVMNIPVPILSWVGAVITGIYWFDVRPQLRSIIRGDYSY
ncbi:DUF2516 family protein [Corynebacterium sp.]|uniref:DUF2516 family protein n=1 Tax=Corynebacterium sp. TaxID=1720 RepID=UPI0026DC7CA1|nr:DUF2516 family protein [Corynebacterium sp.]MDO5031913.1 DUF2516 family protein [Corynebacterium sp.]